MQLERWINEAMQEAVRWTMHVFDILTFPSVRTVGRDRNREASSLATRLRARICAPFSSFNACSSLSSSFSFSRILLRWKRTDSSASIASSSLRTRMPPTDSTLASPDPVGLWFSLSPCSSCSRNVARCAASCRCSKAFR